MTSQLAGQLEGILQFADERQDGSARSAAPVAAGAREHHRSAPAHSRYALAPGSCFRGARAGRTLNKVDTIEGRAPDEYIDKAALYDSTALDPQPMLKLEHNRAELTTRAIDILAPVGFGQRG